MGISLGRMMHVENTDKKQKHSTLRQRYPASIVVRVPAVAALLAFYFGAA